MTKRKWFVRVMVEKAGLRVDKVCGDVDYRFDDMGNLILDNGIVKVNEITGSVLIENELGHVWFGGGFSGASYGGRIILKVGFVGSVKAFEVSLADDCVYSVIIGNNRDWLEIERR